jgi:hypothetical protein
MRHATRFMLSVAFALFIPGPVEGQDAALDLKTASVVTPESLGPREKKAVEMLVDEIERRTQIRPEVLHAMPGDSVPVIVVGNAPSLKTLLDAQRIPRPPAGPPEGYHILSKPSSVWVIGDDSRGVLFGVGRLLREMRLSRQRIELPSPLRIDGTPAMKIRGHQLGYRPKTNSYDGWTVAMWEQYLRDLAVFGCNTIELIPPRSDDQADSPLFPLPQMRMMTEMSRLADAYGLDVSVWYPAMDQDYTKPETVEFAIKEWGDVFSKLPRVDALFVPGGDPGHTRPSVLFALLEKQAANLHRFHPTAQIWLSPQSFDQEQLDEFFRELDKQPAWLTGIVYGPQVRIPLSECRKLTPSRYPIRNYPDITHTHHCQYPVPEWDLAFAVTEAREPICPRPTQMANIFRVTRADTAGFVSYSEGCNDDVNKVIFSALGWDPSADVTEVLRQYARYFIDPKFEEDFAQGVLALERNWSGPVASNQGIDATLKRFRDMERIAPPRVKLEWRFQQAIYRANYDAYVRARLVYETKLEREALAALSEASPKGSAAAIQSAREVLNRAVTQPVSSELRARVFEMAEALFQSVRMQLSVQRYGAESVHRGANLDRIDTPLNNRLWLTRQFEEIEKLDAEPAKLARLRGIVHWSDPGPGGFYDDLGNLSRQPHLMRGVGWNDDPDFYHTPMVRVEDRSEGGTANPITWWSTVGTLFDEPLRMRYQGLDPKAHYLVRLVYPPSGGASPVRLVANKDFEIHPPLRREAQILEFPIPAEATASGQLELTWYPQVGRGHGGRNLQVAEVWIVRKSP